MPSLHLVSHPNTVRVAMRIPVAGGLASFAELREGPRKVPGPCRSPEVLLSPSLLVFPWRRRITSFCIMDLRGQSDSETGSRSPRQVSRAGAPGCASHALSSTPVQLSSPSRAVSVCVCVSEGGCVHQGVCACVCVRTRMCWEVRVSLPRSSVLLPRNFPAPSLLSSP